MTTDWFDPKTWESVTNATKALAATLTALNKIRDRLSRGKKATSKDLQQVIDLITRHVSIQREFTEKVFDLFQSVVHSTADRAEKNLSLIERWGEVTSGVQRIVAIHEQRLNAIEGRRRRGPKKKK